VNNFIRKLLYAPQPPGLSGGISLSRLPAQVRTRLEFQCEIRRSLGRIAAPLPQTAAGGFFPGRKAAIRMRARTFTRLC